MGLIYVYRNTENDKCYVGQTTLRNSIRFNSHKHRAKSGCEYAFYNAVRKYGWGAFTFYSVYFPDNLLDKAEDKFIEKHNSMAPNGYNMVPGGKVPKIKRTKEMNKHLSIVMKGIHKGEDNPFYGKRHKETFYKKIANEYIVADPNGCEVKVLGLKRYCRENGIYPARMYQCANGKIEHHKGYKVRRVQ